MAKLYNCPFCGSEAKLFKSNIMKLGYYILCSNSFGCGVEMLGEIIDDAGNTNYLTLKQLAKRWNRRPVKTIDDILIQTYGGKKK